MIYGFLVYSVFTVDMVLYIGPERDESISMGLLII